MNDHLPPGVGDALLRLHAEVGKTADQEQISRYLSPAQQAALIAALVEAKLG